MTDLFCPACKRPYSLTVPRRICANCNKPIANHHKWRFREDSRAEHRNCADPIAYTEQVA